MKYIQNLKLHNAGNFVGTLTLKPGSKVMQISNVNIEDKFFNGLFIGFMYISVVNDHMKNIYVKINWDPTEKDMIIIW